MNAEPVRATVRYLNSRYRDSEELARIGSRESRRGVTEPREVAIHSARPLASAGELDLDKQGFVLAALDAQPVDHRDADAVREEYYSVVEALVTRLTSADHTVAYEHVVRDGTGDFDSSYARFLHSDYSMERRLTQGYEFFAENGVSLDRNRGWDFAFYNTWQPIGRVVEQSPLTLLDAESVRDDDLLGFVYTGRGQEFYSTMPGFSEAHRFYYFPRMQPNEILVFKQLETRAGRALTSPHTAFHDERAPADAQPRQSIETRVLCAFAR